MRSQTACVALLCGSVLLSGCASRSLSEHQCLAGDWQTVGERDGAHGLPATHVLVHQNACGRHQIVPDSGAYREGWARGVRRFCTADNGYQLGLSGRANPSVCPDSLMTAHQQAYFDGRELYLARAEVRRLEAQIDRMETRRGKIDTEILASAAAQADPSLSPTDRLALVERTRTLLAERESLDAELPVLRRALDSAYDELDDIEQAVALR